VLFFVPFYCFGVALIQRQLDGGQWQLDIGGGLKWGIVVDFGVTKW